MAITDTQAKINDIVNKSLSPNDDTLGDVMRNDVASGMQDLLNEIVSLLSVTGNLDIEKLDKGTYNGDASTLKTYLEGLISACTQKGTYSGTAGQLKAMIDSLATTGTITPDLKNYMELLKNENNVKVVQGVPVGGQKFFLGAQTGALKIKLPTKANTIAKMTVDIAGFTSTKRCLKLMIEFYRVFPLTGGYIAATIMIDNIIQQFTVKLFIGDDDYITIGDITDSWNFPTITISDVATWDSNLDWTTGWDMSFITTFENFGTDRIKTVTPSLNATRVNGTMTSNSQGGITQKKSSTQNLRSENDAGTAFFNVDTTNGKVTERLATSVTPQNNQEMEFQLTSNTQLTIKVKGTDGVVRSANLTLT